MVHLLLAATMQMPLPQPARSFDAGTTRVSVYGDAANPIALIPGLACGPWVWSREIAHLSKTHTVYALTLSGFDGRPYAVTGNPFEQFDRDFETLLNDEHLSSVTIIGHSLGGTLAFYLAEKHPAQIARVVAVDGLPVFPTFAMADSTARARAAETIAGPFASETHDQLLAFERRFMRTMTLRSDLVEQTAELVARSDPKGIAAWLAADMRADLRPQLVNATMPILELMPYATPSPYTEDDTLSFYRLLLATAPHATVEPITPSRHFAMLDQPDAVERAIDAFLSSPANR